MRHVKAVNHAFNSAGRAGNGRPGTENPPTLAVGGETTLVEGDMQVRQMLKAKPIELKAANDFVATLHRHHDPVYRDKFRVACTNNGKICGVIQAGRPVSRILDNGKTLEVVRCCTDGTKNACSYLYAKMARIAREMGYEKIITYILDSESGCSLQAAGWQFEAEVKGSRTWGCPSRPRNTTAPTCKKQRWGKSLI